MFRIGDLAWKKMLIKLIYYDKKDKYYLLLEWDLELTFDGWSTKTMVEVNGS